MDDDSIRDLFQCLAPLAIRRMFGGKAIYHQGIIFAFDLGEQIVLKADEQTAAQFEDAGCSQWFYTDRKTGKSVMMPYWSLPDAALDDSEEMAIWAKLAYEAGLRRKKPKKAKRTE